ncbi:FAD:protein FMN transferase [Aquisediminimonas sediminicola]|uniref:FAD:protein FMN transferase n=1 Tax=Alteraquisediminimonas sediminicola TaxID=2676787 RepID=UPI001C8E6925|nr:FAD:protein FMN transferase [Aquisediminimonas sediminicola]
MRWRLVGKAELITRCRPYLGTFVEISVPDRHANAIEPAFATIAHVQQCMSFHAPDSDLARLRDAPAGVPVAVDRNTVAVLRVARELYDRSDGLFDVTIGRELVRDGFLPRVSALHLGRYTGCAVDIEIIDDQNVCCHRPMLIDLGGIAKGYAVDRAVEVLIAHQVDEGLVNAGGDLRIFGERVWPIALRDADDQIRWTIDLPSCALASSANLQDRRRSRGRMRTPHIGEGREAVASSQRTSVIADRCIIADAMTKIAMASPALAVPLLNAYGAQLLADPDEGMM